MTVILKTVNLKSVVVEVNKKLFCHSLNYSKETIRQHSYCGVAVHNSAGGMCWPQYLYKIGKLKIAVEFLT